MQIFITGTDTNIGKTIISAWLALHFKAFYWKPIQTGSELGDTDSQIVASLLTPPVIYATAGIFHDSSLFAARGNPSYFPVHDKEDGLPRFARNDGVECNREDDGRGERIIAERYVFKAPVSPHLAAEIEGQRIDLGDFILPQTGGEHLIVEGAGGILTPVNESDTMLQLVQKLKLPAIIVARSSLGTINHTCLTIEALRNAGVPVLGVIMNGTKNEENKRAIEYYGKVPVLDEVEKFEQLDYAALKSRVPSQKLMSVIHEPSNVR